MLNKYFVHLHLHSEYSLLDGCGSLEKYIDKAIELDFKYLAITDHGNIDGAIQFQKKCKEKGLKSIIGCELYIVPNRFYKGDKEKKIKDKKKEKRGHLVALVKNQKGWINLLKMLTIGHNEGFYKRPRVDYDTVLTHSDGLIFLTGCIGSFLILEGGEKFFENLITKQRNDIFIEVMPHNDLDSLQKKHNEYCKNLSEKYNIPLVATVDCHYINDSDTKNQEVLLAIQTKKKWNDPKRFKFSFAKLSLMNANEIIEGFLKQKIFDKPTIMSAMKNTIEIAERCADFSIEKFEVYLPQIPQCKGMAKDQEIQFLKDLCLDGFDKKISNKELLSQIQYKDRYLEEINLIVELGFERYFLIVWELINWCKENDIMIGPGRGSSGGCLVAYLLGITKVDPLKYNLLFFRFISPDRIDLPDIDIDFEDIKRQEVRNHLEEIYSKNCVAGVSTFSKMKGRGALRDVARVFDIPMKDVNLAAKSIITRLDNDSRNDLSILDAFEAFEDGIKFKKKYPEATKIAIDLEGQVKNCGIHAAAMIVSEDDLTQGKRAYLKLDKKNGGFIVNWDKKDIEHVGLMKLDVLGLNALTILNSTRKLIKETMGKDLDFEKISMDDKKIFDEFTKGNCVGIFQFGSLGLRKLCADLKINNFKDLIDANALFRPGTLRSRTTNAYIARKNKQEEWKYQHPYLEKITNDTYGIILYQEQIMLLMYNLAGMEWKVVDSIRKIIGKSQGTEKFLKFKDDFIKGCKEKKTLDEKSAGKLWDILSSHGSYSFNLSHAVEYSTISYWMMFLKLYYPSEFIACFLSYGQSDMKYELIEEAKRIGLGIQLPKIGLSDAKIWKVKDKTLYVPFLEMKGIGEKTAKKISLLNNTKGFFESDKAPKINKNIKSLLNDIKAFDEDKSLTEEEKEKFRPLFSFEISSDPMRKYKQLKKLLEENIKIKNLRDTNLKKIDKERYLYFGQMIDIKLGYSQNSGNVYGTIKDKTGYQMVIFSSKIYNEKKYIIEHCGGEWALLECNVPSKSNNLICHNAWIGEELLKGNLDGLNIDLGKIKRFKGEDISNCRACDLRKTAKFPVPHSMGRYNAVIVGEAPGKNENIEGRGFVGDAGQILWKKLKRYGLERYMFHITNICKCWPGRGNATPSISSVKICGQWLEKEIEGLKPFIILALGNTSLQFFKGEKAGITAMSGVTEWDDKYGCWICYCVHPAILLHSREEAKELFNKGIKNFYEKIQILGGKEFEDLS
ncbi:MAG: DNA polymerase III subunit alpha [Candidatus Thorarchaeota archaeon]